MLCIYKIVTVVYACTVCVGGGVYYTNMNTNMFPDVYRKRLMIEGLYGVTIANQTFVADFLARLSEYMGMTVLSGPHISSATGRALPIHQGFEGQIVWAESGASLYVWTLPKFCTLDIYSCKDFDSQEVLAWVANELAIVASSYYQIPDESAVDDPRIEVRQTHLGRGVFATQDIPEGTVISYIDGQIHFAQNESEVFALAKDHAVPFGQHLYRNSFSTKAVLLNHSCEPNCYVKEHFYVTTCAPVRKGEELRYSYSLFCDSDWVNPEGSCLCGTDTCNGKILPWRDLPVVQKKKYLPYLADWILLKEMRSRGFVSKLEQEL